MAAVALLSLLVGMGLHGGRTVSETDVLSEIAPGVEFSQKGGAPPHYSSHEAVVAFNTSQVGPSPRGYAGPIEMLVALRSDGRLVGVRILAHRETKNYVHHMETVQYLDKFVGKSVGDPFEVDGDVDGISRATVSVEALAATLRDSSRAVAAAVYGIRVPRGHRTIRGGDLSWAWYVIIFGLSLGFFFASRTSRAWLRARDLSLIGGILVVGLYLSSPFSVIHVYNLVLLRGSSSPLWYAIVGAGLLSAVAVGRLYCGWICPFGALSEFIGRIPVRKWRISAAVDDRWRGLKYLLLAVVSALVLVSGKVDYGNFETYVTLFSFHGSVVAWALVAVALAANVKVVRFWCRFLCPLAALLGLLSRQDARYPSARDCPMANRMKPPAAECIRCNRCFATEGGQGYSLSGRKCGEPGKRDGGERA